MRITSLASLASGLAGLAVVALPGCGDDLPRCQYVEASDADNGDLTEDVGLEVGAHTRTVCGLVDPGHFDGQSHAVDRDGYRVTIGGTGADLLIQLSGDADTAILDDFSLFVFDTAPLPTLLAGGRLDRTRADHAAFRVSLPAGAYDLVVAATAPGEPSGALAYEITLAPDPAARACPALTQRGYHEAGDGADAAGNDVVAVDFAAAPAFAPTASASDGPEVTGLWIDAFRRYRIQGTSAAVDAAGPYRDRDTYAVTTGADTNELTVRLGWTGDGADLDYDLFEADTLALVASSDLASTTGGELATFAVKPATPYWLWIGASDDGADAAVDYDVAVCGGQFRPD